MHKFTFIFLMLMVGCSTTGASDDDSYEMSDDPSIEIVNKPPSEVKTKITISMNHKDAWKKLHETFLDHEMFHIMEADSDNDILIVSYKTPKPCEYIDCGELHILNDGAQKTTILQNCESSSNVTMYDVEPLSLNHIRVETSSYKTNLSGMVFSETDHTY